MEPNDWKFEVWPEPPKTGMRVGIPRGVKVTHIPTGMVETCDSERSMHANRDKAISALTVRLSQAGYNTSSVVEAVILPVKEVIEK